MAAPTYSRNNLISAAFDDTIQANLANQVDLQDAANKAIRELYLDVDLKSAKRLSVITPNIFDDVYIYTAPTDLKDYAIIDIRPQAYDSRTLNSRVMLVTPEVFDRKKNDRNLLVSVLDDENTRKLLVNIDVSDTQHDIATMDTLDSGSSTNWVLFGDATNVVLDADNKVQGSGSIKFDLVGSGTTAGISNSNIDSFALNAAIRDAGAAFAWIYVNSITDLTNFIMRIGSSASNYYQMTETTDQAGNSFVVGWNLVRFDFVDKTETGTVDDDAITYVAVYMTKDSAKADDGYRIDDIQLHSGEIYEILYYSKFPWQNTSLTYLENSTSGTDWINVDTDEIGLASAKVQMEVYRRLRDWEMYNVAKSEYNEQLAKYKLIHPSERAKLEQPGGYAKPF